LNEVNGSQSQDDTDLEEGEIRSDVKRIDVP